MTGASVQIRDPAAERLPMRISALVDLSRPSARLRGVKQDITAERRGAAAT